MKVLAVTNLWPTDERPDLGSFIERQVAGLRRIGLEVVVEFVDRAGLGRRAYRGVGRRVRDQIGQTAPDVVHVLYGGILADRTTRRSVVGDRPTVVSFCGADLLGEPFDGHRLSAAAGVRASVRAARRADAVVVKSAAMAAALPRALATPVHVIPNGVDLERFGPGDGVAARQALGWREADLHVLFVAHRQSPSRKRPDLAADACAVAREEGLDIALHVVGGVANEEMPTWLQAADVLLFTSAQEGSPNVVREALACGTPVVSVAVGDVADQLRGIVGGHVVAAEPAALAHALRQVATHPVTVDAGDLLATRSIDAVARRLEGLYEAVAGR